MNTKRTTKAAAGPFSTQPSGPRPVGCFSALLARPVSIQIWALRSRLEKQPTDLQRCHHYMRDGTLIGDLAAKPEAFNFFQAVRRLEAEHPGFPRVGWSDRIEEDFLRFCQIPSLAFAPSSIEAVKE